ncbi:excalibur calcium-binding domain-containing protein [Nonomuraea rhodomycinica]|uniref:Excalibur calcium-binding domain-containing protein n=1 Tax=Nonomuraea rhodomycinica TaxID=1712872 RepID=A0A7Y6ING3_9ACTN|nr:excalibur calcium-binding domain-containing protein [Nonomuraea rhodomycinica]NUW40134.1 excalibur calcium-binding domain-containing protein [Nonomuraea rhodomycinica]
MDKPEEPPPAVPEEPQASRLTTIVLIVSLVLVVVIAGVLGTVAVLMTRSPDAPLLGGAPPQRLPTPIHFAPIREQKPAPCPGAEAALDDRQTTCYLLEDGVTVEAVQRIEPVREKDGTYSVRVAIAPKYKDKVVELIDEMAATERQIAVVLVPRTVIAAPVVTQTMNGDSLSIAGYTRQEAEALVARLLGSPPATGQPGTGQPGTDQPGAGQPSPGATNPGATNPGATDPGATDPGATNPGTQSTPGTGVTDPSATSPATGPAVTPGGTNTTTGGRRTPDRKFASCKEAVAAGFGPYTRGLHEEYAWYTDVDGNGVACNSADLR